jgi:acetoin utilization deacetylase AcuC-like enzyme
MKIFYSDKYCDTAVAYDTTRKAAHVSSLLQREPIANVKLVEPAPVSLDELSLSLDNTYFSALKTGLPRDLAASNGIGWDETLLKSVLYSSGGVVRAVESALGMNTNSGSLSSGLHHARFKEGGGFCTVNGLVLGAKAAFKSGARRVLCLDLDAHAGGGTASYIEHGFDGVFEQLDVSLIHFDTYTDIKGATLIMSSSSTYIADIERALSDITAPSSIDLVLYNAGMDPHERAGGVRGVTTETLAKREELVFSWAKLHRIPVAWVLAGGYSTDMSIEELAGLHRLTAVASCL